MKNLKLRKTLFAIGSSFVIMSLLAHEHKYEPNYEIIADEESDAFATIGDLTVYICSSRKEIKNMQDIASENDILIADERNTQDPNMIIYDSYQITDKDLRNDILCCLLEYERMYPSEWNRTIESMRNEWIIHNISYYFHYQRKSAENVDLNNEDETKYNSILLKKLFFN